MPGDFQGKFLKLSGSDIQISLDKIANEKQKNVIKNEKFKKIFDFFDNDSNGTLSVEEITDLIEKIKTFAQMNGNMELEDDEVTGLLNETTNAQGKSLLDEGIEISELFGFVKSLESDEVEEVPEDLSEQPALSSEEDEVIDYKDGDTLSKRVIKSKDNQGNIIETTVEYQDGKPTRQTVMKNGNKVSVSTYTFKERNGVKSVQIETSNSDGSKVIINASEVDENGNISEENLFYKKTINLDGSTFNMVNKKWLKNRLNNEKISHMGIQFSRFLGDVEKIMDVYEENPEFVERLLEDQISDEFGEINPRFNADAIVSLANAYKKNPELIERFLSEKAENYFGDEIQRFRYASEIIDIFDLYNDNSELIERLLNEKSKNYRGEEILRFDPSEIISIVNAHKENPELLERLLAAKKNAEEDSELRFSGSDIETIMNVYKDNPDLVERLLAETTNFKGNIVPRFNSGLSIERIVNAYNFNPDLTIALLEMQAKDDNGESVPQFTPDSIEKIVLAYNNDQELVESFISNISDEIFTKEEIDTLFGRMSEWLELREIANSKNQSEKLLTDKEIANIMLNNQYSFLWQSMDNVNLVNLFKNSDLVDFISENKTEGSRVSFSISKKDKGYYQIFITESDSGNKITLDFKFTEDNEFSILSTEKTVKDGNILTTIKEFTDGRRIETEITTDGKGVQQGYKKTYYDSQGNRIRTEEVIPSDEIPGEYIINTYEYIDGQIVEENVGSIKTSENDEGTRARKRLTSTDGCVTREIKIIKENSSGNVFTIVDKDGNELFHTKRTLTQIDENHYRSEVNGQKYDVTFDNGRVIASKIDDEGNITETITLDTDVLDPELTSLYKQLTGDYFFMIKSIGLKRIEVGGRAAPNNACFVSDESSIYMSKELANDPFVFAHEFGHALDCMLLKDMSLYDNEFAKIWQEEVETYIKNSGDEEALAINYFTDPTRSLVSAKEECVAEAAAIVSGFIKTEASSILGTRSVILEQHFPRSIAYVANAMQNPEEYLAKIKSLRGDLDSGILW